MEQVRFFKVIHHRAVSLVVNYAQSFADFLGKCISKILTDVVGWCYW